jgi:hypothetical protein
MSSSVTAVLERSVTFKDFHLKLVRLRENIRKLIDSFSNLRRRFCRRYSPNVIVYEHPSAGKFATDDSSRGVGIVPIVKTQCSSVQFCPGRHFVVQNNSPEFDIACNPKATGIVMTTYLIERFGIHERVQWKAIRQNLFPDPIIPTKLRQVYSQPLPYPSETMPPSPLKWGTALKSLERHFGVQNTGLREF